MILHDSLTHILADARDKSREIRFIDGDRDESVLTFGDLWERAVALLGVLQRRGMSPGDELVIFTKSNETFVVAFWAAVLGGIVPVPVAVGISDEHRLKLFRILTQLQRATLYTENELHARLSDFATQRDLTDIGMRLQQGILHAAAVDPGAPGDVVTARADDVAFIQYSSGSTSEPKGVCLTHFNLATNIRAIVEGLGWAADDQALSWMPLTHDMGLIGFHLSVMAAGMNHAVMDTGVFVRRPLLWMSKASELQATQLCSPNFGYKHFLKLFQRKGLDGLDLSRVRLILNGAEPISWDLCESFLSALAPFGLRRETLLPVYGLAEATVAVTIPTPGNTYSRIIVDRHKLRVGEPFVAVPADHEDAVSFIKVGPAVRDCEIRIADDDGVVLGEGLVGNIQIRGGNVTGGLYNDEEASAGLFTPDGWLQSGDCGVIVDDELVITGRAKDIVIVNGQNYYPHDIEEIIAQVEGLDLGKVVVCGVNPAQSQGEELLVFLLYRQDAAAFEPLAAAVRDIVGEQAGLEVSHVIPVSRIPKTTSGKVQRVKLANAYLDGEFASEIATQGGSDEAPDDLDADPLVREIELLCREHARERKIGPDDNLFEVGVSSLTLTEIVLALEEKHPGKVDISDLFDYPTIRELANFIRR